MGNSQLELSFKVDNKACATERNVLTDKEVVDELVITEAHFTADVWIHEGLIMIYPTNFSSIGEFMRIFKWSNKKPRAFTAVAIKVGLKGNAFSRFISYMMMRWGEQERLKCETGSAEKWALRFKRGVEYVYSDDEGRTALDKINRRSAK